MSRRWLRGKCHTQGKIRCRDQEAAEQFARHVARVSMGHEVREHMRPRPVPTFTYQCRFCGYWHITRQASFTRHGVTRHNDPVPMEDA